jgi:hypothetical protein
MLLAQQCYLAARENDDRTVTSEHAAVAFDMAMKADALALTKDIERLRDITSHALSVCQAVAHGEPPYSRGPAYPDSTHDRGAAADRVH